MPTIKKTIEPVRNAAGKLVGFYEHTDTLTPVRMSKGRPVDPPPRQALRTATPTTPPRPKPTPARQPTPSPVAFLAPHLGRVITNTHCCKCQQTHRACQCWPANSYSASQLAAMAAEAAAPRTRANTFEHVVERQRANGILPGTPTPAPAKTGTGVPRLNSLEEVVRLRKERGLM